MSVRSYLRSIFQDCWKALRAFLRLDPNPRGHYLRERYGIDRKPPGWNEAVKGWFFRGPELREPDEDFRDAFRKRSSRR